MYFNHKISALIINLLINRKRKEIKLDYRWFLFIVFALPCYLQAQTKITQHKTYQQEGTIYVDVDSDIALNETVLEALKNGITLKFSYEFVIKTDRWYRIKPLATLKKSYWLFYHNVTKQYHVKNPLTYEVAIYNNAKDAIEQIASVKQFPLIHANLLKDTPYELSVRFIIDETDLPNHMKLKTLFSDYWKINSEWEKWSFP
ncbi:DUF4390 domain-containing protein [Ostreibacterium oceani]|uniref:DUF4390 domain-containing protein n=1 Tax=Ostreibacterium oceani TaxID=2654998 RepID=A0A6N7ETR1_9GAMM|nr:DUF4390 domain-containing protein [Ostreibacterium oceani]MPV85333.1 DUF4390 domain-containing protein [Ostreibacterium oceani]